MSPAGNSITASAAISSVPKRELSTVRVDMEKRLLKVTDERGRPSSRLAEEIHERALHEARAGAQRGLVGGLLRVEVDEGLGDVGVLGAGELLGRGLLELGQPRDGGLEPVRARAVAGADLEQLVEVRVERLEVGGGERVAIVVAQRDRRPAQNVEQLAVAAARAVAEELAPDGVDRERDAGADLTHHAG